MKPSFAAVAALSFAAPALAQTAPPDAHAAISTGATQAVGRIRSVDAKAGTITIHHAPIAALGWPAMTMTFRATPEAVRAAKPGETVKFTLAASDDRVIAVQPR